MSCFCFYLPGDAPGVMGGQPGRLYGSSGFRGREAERGGGVLLVQPVGVRLTGVALW